MVAAEPQGWQAAGVDAIGQSAQPGPGQGWGRLLRDQFAETIDRALLIGVLAGVVVAVLVGTFSALRMARPLKTLQQVTRRIAGGRYEVEVPRLKIKEFDALGQDVARLGAALAETEQRRTRLIGEVGHEMRTPLTVIDGYIEGMIDGIIPADKATLAELSAETRRLRRLADDLSTLSRAEEGRFDLEPALADVAAVVGEAAERLRPQAEDAGIALVIDDEEKPCEAEIDSDRIAQVVTNLVGNALRATPGGGTVQVTTRVEGENVVVQVRDTGVGLAPEDLEKIFERFYRVPQEGAAVSGSGIGLPLSRSIAEAHGGTLTAASDGNGRGSVFTVTLPRPGEMP